MAIRSLCQMALLHCIGMSLGACDGRRAAELSGAGEPHVQQNNAGGGAGGLIAVAVHLVSAIPPEQAEVVLLEGVPCTALDELGFSVVAGSAEARQQVSLRPGVAAAAVFSELDAERSYTVVAIGRVGGPIVARGCRENLYIRQEMVDEKKPLGVSVDLVDLVRFPSAGVSVVTRLHHEIEFAGLAALLESIASGGGGPAAYVVGQMISLSEGTDLARWLSSHRQPIVEALGGDAGRQHELQLMGASRALASIQDVQLHSKLSLRDASHAPAISAPLELSHWPHKFTAIMLSSDMEMIREDFPAASAANQRTSSRRVFAASVLALESQTTIAIQNRHALISAHELSLPLADALIGKIFHEYLGDYRAERIVNTIIRCDDLGQFAAASTEPQQAAAVTETCHRALEGIVARMQRTAEDDLGAAASDQRVLLVGSAEPSMRSDGTTIGWLKSGRWKGFGSFEARSNMY